MLSSVEAWWAGLCALPFEGTQGGNPFLTLFFIIPFHGLLINNLQIKVLSFGED
jgi:hypothetical protein